MPSRAVRMLMFACAAALGAGCGEGPLEPITELPRGLSLAEIQLVDASTAFAFDMLRQVPLTNPDSPNVFLSPLSASMALGMTMNGTDAATWTQMRDVLGFDGMEEEEINEAYRDLIGLLRGLDPSVEFGLGNSVWARQDYPFYDDFKERTRTYFDAHVQELDFRDPGAPAIINGWVEDVTRGRIEEMVIGIPKNVVMYLINAVYFNADWTSEFDAGETRDRPFHRADGTTSTVKMMEVHSDFRMFNTDAATGVELPYGGGAFTAVAVLPNGPVEELVATLDETVWMDWMTRLEEREPAGLRVRLPRLELEYERILNGDLQALGMTDAFDSTLADFTRLSPVDEPAGVPLSDPELYISEVKQKTFLKVDEAGTEAAAATSVAIAETTSAGPATLSFDRPFLFVLRERFSGSILFIGVIGDPAV